MARMADGSGGGSAAHDNAEVRISVQGEDRIDISDVAIADATLTRDGQDLVLSAHGEAPVIIEGYFSAEAAPILVGSNGASLSPELVNSFLTAAPEYAQAATATDESPVGAVEEIKGNASVTHADGTTEPLALGAPIYQGDVITTDAQGAVNVVFVDETSMAVSANARMAIDEYSFDPASESGTTNFSVLRGVFVFTSGLIGRDDPDDVAIETPVGSIGIRGTIIAGNINPGGESEITVVEGAIVVKNAIMEKTLAVQFETIKLGGLESEMTEMGVLSAKAVGTAFGAVSDVAPSLFSAINDAAKDQGQGNDGNGATDGNAGEGADESSPSDSNNPPQGEQAPAQELQMNEMNTPFKTNTFGETVKEASLTTHETVVAHDTSTIAAGVRGETGSIKTTIGTRVDTPDLPPSLAANPTTPTDNTDPGTSGGGGSGGGGTSNNIELTNLQTTDNVRLIGSNLETSIGYSVTALGDVNNDGYADIMFSNNANIVDQNVVYVAYGSSTGIKSGTITLANLDGYLDGLIGSLSDIDANAGDVAKLITPNLALGDSSTTVVAGIGDFNGDGVEDYIVGQQHNGAFPNTSGMAYIMSGAMAAQVVTFEGLPGLGQTGHTVSALGDINNDGYDDVLIGAPGANSAHIIYGGASMWGNNYTPANSHPVETITVSNEFGFAAIGIGDYDGDGYNDFAISAPMQYSAATSAAAAGRVTIYSGQTRSEIMHADGWFTQQRFGQEIINLGDINGDGKSDIVIGGDEPSSDAYVLFGGTTSTINNVNTGLNGLNGFKISIAGSGSQIIGGGAAGDFNGDGYNDFAIAVKDGSDASIYVVFGNHLESAISDGSLTLDELGSHNSFKMTYANGANMDFDISNGGDTNGDGYDDLIIGIHNADNSGFGTNGQVFVVEGRGGGNEQTTTGFDIVVRDNETGDQNATVGVVGARESGQMLLLGSGHTGQDSGHGAVSMRAIGNNFANFEISRNDFNVLEGGSGGGDTIIFNGAPASILDLTNVNSESIKGMERITFGGDGTTIKLTLENIFNLLKNSDTGVVTIDSSGHSGSLNIVDANAWGADAETRLESALAAAGVSYNGDDNGTHLQFDIGGYTLLIENAVNTTVTTA